MSDRICYCGKAILLVFRKLRSRKTARSPNLHFFGCDVAPNHASSSGKRFQMTSCELLSPKSLPIFCLLNLHILCRNWHLAMVWCEFRISIKCQICEFVRRCVTFGWALGGILLVDPEKCCTVVDFWAEKSLTSHASFNLSRIAAVSLPSRCRIAAFSLPPAAVSLPDRCRPLLSRCRPASGSLGGRPFDG